MWSPASGPDRPAGGSDNRTPDPGESAIAPPRRGLPGLAATSPAPVTRRLDLAVRPHEAIERAIYSCAPEPLTDMPAQRVHELGGAGHAFLEEVAHAGRPTMIGPGQGRLSVRS
ncbi:hypothetical protein ACF07V_08375 [Streptomyces sp. NPDC015661]|uniref:hypothetical protein n=1 Tax=Streptomyces sp. NPDC015661 TaxID=3364961 RepID=UPI0036F76FE1